jgi:outer membrane protein W
MAIKTKMVSVALFLFLLVSAEAKAQDWFWAAQYQTALSVGDTKDFTDQFSGRNFAVEGRAIINENFSAGLFLGWNVFNEEVADEDITIGGATVSGYQFRYVNAFPILATAHYYLGRRGGPRGYIGAGAGTYYIENRLEMGLTALTVDNWHLGVAPEAGIVFPFNRYAAGYLSAKYNYAFEAGGIKHTYWTFGIGIGSR